MVARQSTIVGTGTADGQVGAEVNARLPSQTPGIELTSRSSAASRQRSPGGRIVGRVGPSGRRHRTSKASAAENGSRGQCGRGRKHPQHRRRPALRRRTAGRISHCSPARRRSTPPSRRRLRRMNRRPTWPATRESSMATATGPPQRDMGAFEAPAPPAPPDTTPPDTRIQMPKQGKKKLVAGRHGFALHGQPSPRARPGSHFECRLDAGKFAPCSSPFQKRLAAGLHRFEVRAVDAAGNVDPTPARESLRIAARAQAQGARAHHHRPL